MECLCTFDILWHLAQSSFFQLSGLYGFVGLLYSVTGGVALTVFFTIFLLNRTLRGRRQQRNRVKGRTPTEFYLQNRHLQ